MRARLAGLAIGLGAATGAAAQAPRDSAAAAPAPAPVPAAVLAAVPANSTVTIVPGARYRAGWLHRAFFGSRYRELWATPITVPVLDLRTYAGGLRPTRKGGGKQTRSLRFKSADGRRFAFRSVDKDPSPLLPPELRETLVDRIFQDQISAGHPAGALVVAALLEAVGVVVAPPALFVLPDDPALGEFRAEFAGLLGTLEERPTDDDEGPGFAGARKVADTDELFERLDRSLDERVDTRAFLAARLMDLFVGDWDRHEGQWKWIKVGEGKRAPWLPVPYDRDQAFVRYDGLLLDLARTSYPQLVNFGDRYPGALGLTWNGKVLDRRLLVGLEWTVWDSVARALQARLTDAAIDRAVARLPAEYAAKDGVRLARALKHRRDHLPRAARAFYRLLAGEADVYASDDDELAVATRSPGTLDLALSGRELDAGSPDTGSADASSLRRGSAEGAAPLFRRRFLSGETKEVRLHLRGGRDSVLVDGAGGGPKLRIVAGDGRSTIVDLARGGWTRVYDSLGGATVGGSHPPSLDQRPYRRPEGRDAAPRDWGHRWRFNPWLGYAPDVGLFVGFGPTLYRYGFRKDPYASRLRARAGYATGADAFRVEVAGDFRRESSGRHVLVAARASGIEVLRFFGFGNETPFTQPSDFYKVYQQQYSVSAAVAWSPARRLSLSTGPVVKYAVTDLARPTLLSQVRPYGSDDFGQVGAAAGVRWDTRDVENWPTRGVHAVAGGSVYPALWDVRSTFGEAHAQAAVYLSAALPLRPTLALRAGGQRVWGEYPFHEAAHIGGESTVRGLRTHRYIGDASAFGSAELRLRLTRFDLVLPGEMGVFGLADAGRVWLSGESSDRWHHAVGGGIWFAYLSRANTLSVAVARAEGRTGVYLRGGLAY